MFSFAKIKQTFLTATLLVLFFVAPTISLVMMSGYHQDGMPMSNCPFAVGEVALCGMNTFDHIASWQAMFTTLPPETFTLVLLALAILLVSGLLRYLYKNRVAIFPVRELIVKGLIFFPYRFLIIRM